MITDGEERLKSSPMSGNGNDSTSPVHQTAPSRPQTGNLLAEQVPAAKNLDATSQENLKNRFGDTSSPGWARPSPGMENRPKSVTECLKSLGPVPANKWRMGVQHRSAATSLDSALSTGMPKSDPSATATTTILTESSTVSIPLHPIGALGDNSLSLTPKYKTMPSPGSTGSTSSPQLTLNEILEDGDTVPVSTAESGNSKCRVVRRTGYEQRRSKFHKTRTTSCSSSDASDDDSESRKKRAHKLGASAGKPLPPRRDSHDDSSDSQDPGGSGGGGGGGGGVGNGEHATDTPDNETNRNDNGNNTNTTTTTTTTTGGRHRSAENQVIFGRRHRAGRRRAGETRLRESQSLNRITEVQEAEGPSSCHNHCHAPRNSAVLGSQSMSSSSSSVSQSSISSHGAVHQQASQASITVQKAKGFGARLLQSWSLSSAKASLAQPASKPNSCSPNGKCNKQESQRDACQRIEICCSDRDLNGSLINQIPSNDKENRNGGMHRNDCKNRKIRLLSRYFAVHKKLCVPLPGLFGKGRLYKARSCGSIARDRVSPPSPKSMLFCATADDKWRERQQWCDAKHQHRGSDGDINQNLAQLVQDGVMSKGCSGLPTVCHIHLGDASKCCSLC